MSVSGRAPGPHGPCGVGAASSRPVADIAPARLTPTTPTRSAARTTPRRRSAGFRAGARRVTTMSTPTSGPARGYAGLDSRRMGAAPFLLFAAFLAVMVLVAVLGVLAAKKRREGFAALAAARGWTYIE